MKTSEISSKLNTSIEEELEKETADTFRSLDQKDNDLISAAEFETINSSSNLYSQEPSLRSRALWMVFNHFDGDGDGKISIEELKNCLAGCFDVPVDSGEIERFLHIDQNSMIGFSHFAKVFESEEDDGKLFQNLRKMTSIGISLNFEFFFFREEAKKGNAFSCFDQIHDGLDSKSDLILMNSFEGSTKFNTFILNDEAKKPINGQDSLNPDAFSYSYQIHNNLFQNYLSKTKLFEISSKPFISNEKGKKLIDGPKCSFADAFRYFDQNKDELISSEELQMLVKIIDNNDHVIDLNHLPLAPIRDEDRSNISKLRDIFLGLTGQAAVAFLAFSPTRHLYIIVAVNALAFLFLLISFCLGGSKHKAAERITGAIGIAAAAAEFFMTMTAMFFA